MDLANLDPSQLLRQTILGMSRNDQLRATIEKAPVSRDIVKRFVGGVTTPEAVRTATELVDTRRLVTIDYLGEDTLDPAQATHTRDAYLHLLSALAEAGLTADGAVEVSLKLSALGQALGRDGNRIALENARAICQAAANAGTTVTLDMEDHTTTDLTLSVGTTVTLDMEDHTTTDLTLSVLRDLRQDWPWVGAVLQSYLYRTEQDCRDLAHEGSRVRLCKGTYKEPESVAFPDKLDVDRSYVRCLKVLMEGDGYPMIATHDPRLVDIATVLADKAQRDPDTFEFQMLLGIRPEEQLRLAAAGNQVRVYLPYGDEWYGYLMRRMAERPQNLGFFLRGLATRG